MNNRSHTPSSHSQSGFAAILVTMILMIVISLIVLAFAQISRREQRQSLDRQLSTQAFYAAETGVNDAQNYVKGHPNIGSTPKTDCPADTAGVYGQSNPSLSAADYTLNGATGVGYTCLLITPAPDTLAYAGVGTSSKVVPINSANGSSIISKISFSWHQAPNQPASLINCPTSTSLPQPPSVPTCTFGLARIDLVPVGGTYTRDNLSKSTMSAYFEPSNSATGDASYAPNSGTPPTSPIYSASCALATGICTANIISLDRLNEIHYYARIRFLYQPTQLLEVKAFSGNSQLNLSGAQLLVDSTGKAQDVLRRILVRVSTQQITSGSTPDYAIQTTDSICKQFNIAPNVDTGRGTGEPTAGGSDTAGTDSDCSQFGF